MQDNVLPPSYYTMRKVLSVRDPQEVEWHSCPLGCSGWPPTPQSHWQQHASDACQHCKGARFTKQGSKLVPSRVRVAGQLQVMQHLWKKGPLEILTCNGGK